VNRVAWRKAALVVASASGLVAALAVASPASAAPDQQSMFMEDNLLLYRGDQASDTTLQELKSLGVDAIRVSVHWRAIAPDHRSPRKPASLTDETNPAQYPASNFDPYDHLLRNARRLGIRVLIDVTGGAPLWATGRIRGRVQTLNYKPSSTAFARFVEMLGRRYNGTYHDENQGGGVLPRVDTWSIWNEPNQGALLRPQWYHDSTGHLQPYSPMLYRRLVRGALAGLAASGHQNDTVLLGETAPLGADKPTRRTRSYRVKTSSIRPGLFLRELFCLGTSLHPLHGDSYRRRHCDFASRSGFAITGYAHHPYSVTSPPDRQDPDADNFKLADRARLYRILDAAAAAHRIPPNVKVWFTEYGYQTLPPDPLRGVTLADQSEWLSEAEKITWADPRVAALTQFLMRDDLPRMRYPPNSIKRWGTYQTGLEWANGSHKPAYDAYRLPFVAPGEVPAGRPAVLWGQVRAAPNGVPQAINLQFAPGSTDQFRTVGGPIQVKDPYGYFQVSVVPNATGRWRFVWRASSSSAPTRANVPVLDPPPPPPQPGREYASSSLEVRIG
jgi:hypothetical protein